MTDTPFSSFILTAPTRAIDGTEALPLVVTGSTKKTTVTGLFNNLRGLSNTFTGQNTFSGGLILSGGAPGINSSGTMSFSGSAFGTANAALVWSNRTISGDVTGATGTKALNLLQLTDNMTAHLITMALAGRVKAGVVLSLIATSASIVGSPVTVSYTETGAEADLAAVSVAIVGVINGTTALTDAGVAAIDNGDATFSVTWPAGTTIAWSKSVSGLADGAFTFDSKAIPNRQMALFNYRPGAGSMGATGAFNVKLTASATTGDSSIGSKAVFAAFNATTTVTANQGGVSSSVPGGVARAANFLANISGGATYMAEGTAAEFDLALKSPASVGRMRAIALVNYSDKRADFSESFIAMGTKSTGATIRTGINFGGGNEGEFWAYANDSILLKASELSGTDITADREGYPAGSVLDANIVDITNHFVRMQHGTNGPWVVGGDATMQIGACKFTPSSTGLGIDSIGAIATAVSINAAGTGWHANDVFSFGAGGRGMVTTVNGSGAVTGYLISRYPYLATSVGAPATLAATASLGVPAAGRGLGTGLVFNITWDSARTKLTLQPSGGPIVTNLPIAAAGLPTGALWNNAGVVNVA